MAVSAKVFSSTENETVTIRAGGYRHYMCISTPPSPKSLDEASIQVGRGMRVDVGVERLVKALVIYGVNTMSSCDGGIDHSPGGGAFHGVRPWVEVSMHHVDMLRPLIEEFNKSSEIQWEFKEGIFGISLTTKREATSTLSLKDLSKSADALAERIFMASVTRRYHDDLKDSAMSAKK